MRKFTSAAAALVTMMSAANAEQIWLTMDYVRPYKLETPVQNIIIGNPAIADVTVQDSTHLLLFGKSPGLTNIFLVDENGDTIDNMIVRVRTNTSEMLTFYRGPARTTYNCTSNCEATVTVGDDNAVFGEVSGQVAQKFGQAAAGASGSSNGGGN